MKSLTLSELQDAYLQASIRKDHAAKQTIGALIAAKTPR